MTIVKPGDIVNHKVGGPDMFILRVGVDGELPEVDFDDPEMGIVLMVMRFWDPLKYEFSNEIFFTVSELVKKP